LSRTLDWRPHWDDRNVLFGIMQLDCFSNGKARKSVRRTKSIFLDQGVEGACTGFGTAHALASSPKPDQDIADAVARDIYHEARRQDEWEGENYEGSSVNGAMKAARQMGFISSWHWCFNMPEMRHALSYHGPVVIGVNWYSGMFQPNAQGVLEVTGYLAGGHCLEVSGYKGDLYRLENSWGKDWGDNGGAWIRQPDLVRLLLENGEFACPKKT
jgi:hypothetical protein